MIWWNGRFRNEWIKDYVRKVHHNKSWTWKRLTPCSCEALWNNSFIPFWFQDEELVDAKLSTSDYCRRVSCHGMSHHIASHILLSRYMSHSHIILLSRYMYHIKTRNTTLLPQPPPPPPEPAGLSLTANLFIVHLPCSVLMSTCTYFCVRH